MTEADLLVGGLAERYDLAGQGEGALPASVLRRLHSRQAGAGKDCERCRERKPLSAFSRHSRNLDGLRRYCRECANAAETLRLAAQSGAPLALSNCERESL